METIGQCGGCIYWDRSSLNETGEQATAACIRRSPAIDFRSGNGCWPHTAEDDACGDFVEHPDPDIRDE